VNYWYVFTARSGKERLAASRLGERGHLADVPLLPIAKRKRSSGNMRRPLPAIPGYVMIYMGEPTPKLLRAIMSVEFANGDPCVHRRIPGKVSEGQMMEFLAFLSQLREVSSVKQSMKPGDPVRVKYGSLEDKTAKVVGVKGAKTNILIELFNALRVVEVKTEALELVGQPEKNATSGRIVLIENSKSSTTSSDGGRFATGEKLPRRTAVLRA
jgi:transcription antitermination factor NusG